MNTRTTPYFDFKWHVAPDYRWVEWLDPDGNPVRLSGFAAHPHTGASLVVEEGHESGPILTIVPGPHRTIQPMDRTHAALFRVFAELEASDEDAVLGFAREYGWLGVTPRLSQVLRLPDGSVHHAEGEPLQLWVNEVAKMREAIWLCEHPKVRKRDKEKLAWLFDSHLQHVQGRMQLPDDGPAELRIAPTNLLSAMWLQLAMAVGGKKFVSCKFCGRQIEISTSESGFRTNRVFCSPSCKTNDYRARRREALKQARRGKSASAVAKLVGTDTATVRRWLEGQKKAT